MGRDPRWPAPGATFRVPASLALIFLGMLCGPFGLEWMGRTAGVRPGVDRHPLSDVPGRPGSNTKAFNENRRSALGFGRLSVAFPFGLSLAGMASFEAGILAAALLGSMRASNTLVADPDVWAAGLDQTRAVRDAVCGASSPASSAPSWPHRPEPPSAKGQRRAMVLDWDGPSPSANLFFGSELDGVGAVVEIPTLRGASHLDVGPGAGRPRERRHPIAR